MNSSTRPTRPTGSTAPSQRSSAAPSTRPAASAPIRARSAASSATDVKPRPTTCSRFTAAAPSSSAPRPSLEALTSLYIALYQLSTLRSASQSSSTTYESTVATLERELASLEAEVGESRERRKVESDLEVLEEVQRDVGVERLLARVVEGLGRSGVLLEGFERGMEAREAREGIYPLQLLLAECSTKLARIDVSALPRISSLLPSLQTLVDLRLQVLTATRAKVEQDLTRQRLQVAKECEKLAISS